MEWYDRLTARVAELGWTNAELARRANVSYDRVSKYMRGDVHHPRGDTLKRLAEAVGLTEEFLWLGVPTGTIGVHTTPGDDLPSMRRALLYRWGDLHMLGVTGLEAPAAVRSLPVPYEDEVGVRAFFVEAPDDSNAPEINEGDRLLCDPDAEPIPGKFVIAIVRNVAGPVLGRYRVRAVDQGVPISVEIVPANDHFPTIRVKNLADMRILGRITHRTSTL